MPEVSWQVESLRATAFYNVGDTPRDVNRLWELLMHRQPDQFTSRPSEGIHVAQGRFGGSEGQLQCQIREGRVDWVLRAAPPAPNRAPEGLLIIDALAGVLPSFRDLGTRWLERSSAISRLAFGAVLLFEVSDINEANKRLLALLPAINLEPEDVADFLFRINRRRPLNSGDRILCNRLSTWSTVQVGSMGISISGGSPPQLIQQTGQSACRLELDMNTMSTLATPPLGGGEAVKVFCELIDLGEAIAKQGDSP